MAYWKTLQNKTNQGATPYLTIDRSLIDLMGWDVTKPVALTVNGGTLIVSQVGKEGQAVRRKLTAKRGRPAATKAASLVKGALSK